MPFNSGAVPNWDGLRHVRLYHVVNGAKTVTRDTAGATLLAAGQEAVITLASRSHAVLEAGGDDFPRGLPSGRMGLYTNTAGTQFGADPVGYDGTVAGQFNLWADGAPVETGGRWVNHTAARYISVRSTNHTFNDGDRRVILLSWM